jgi:hypothetical protein
MASGMAGYGRYHGQPIVTSLSALLGRGAARRIPTLLVPDTRIQRVYGEERASGEIRQLIVQMATAPTIHGELKMLDIVIS